MKKRSGFVTNSSSSSFIIGIKDNTQDNSMNTFLKEMFKNEDVLGATKEELEAYFLYDYCYKSIDELKTSSNYLGDIYDKCIDAINDNMKIIRMSVEYDSSNDIENMIDALEKADVAKMIQEEF